MVEEGRWYTVNRLEVGARPVVSSSYSSELECVALHYIHVQRIQVMLSGVLYNFI